MEPDPPKKEFIMDLESRLDEYKDRYRRASLPGDMRQNYEQLLAFVDAGMAAEQCTNFAGQLASLLECKLDVLFPVAESEEEIDPETLIGEQRYDDLRDAIRHYKRLEGDVEEAILEHQSGDGDETLSIFPTPFQLTPDEGTDPGVLGEVVENLLGQFLHPSLLLRKPPHLPSEDLYDRVVIAGSTLHNLMRLIRCTAGLCPEGTHLRLAAVADDRFTKSMRGFITESDEFDFTKRETKLQTTVRRTMKRKLQQAQRILTDKPDMTVEYEIHEGTIGTLIEKSTYFREPPTLMSIPFHFSGGGYDPASLKPMFNRYTSTEILTI